MLSSLTTPVLTRFSSRIHNNMSKKLLEAYIASLLTEFMDNSMMIGDPDKAADIFTGPFKNFAGITVSELGKTFFTAKMAAKLAFAAVKGAFGAKADFEKIFSTHDSERQSMQSKFQAYYNDAFSLTNNTDLNMVAFMWNPGAWAVAKASMGADIPGLAHAGVGGAASAVGGAARTAGSKLSGYSDYYYESFIRENSEKPLTPEAIKGLQADSKKFRAIEIKKMDEVVRSVREALEMPPEEFMSKYGRDRAELYKRLKDSITDSVQKKAKTQGDSLKPERLQQINAGIDAAIQQLEGQLAEVVKISKAALVENRAQMLTDSANEIEEGLKKQGIDVTKHGLVPVLRAKAEEIKKLAPPEQEQK